MTYRHQSAARCVACGRLQGMAHAAGCGYAKFTLRSAT